MKGMFLGEDRTGIESGPSPSTRNVQCSIRLEGSRIDGEFMMVGYLMENLVDRGPRPRLWQGVSYPCQGHPHANRQMGTATVTTTARTIGYSSSPIQVAAIAPPTRADVE